MTTRQFYYLTVIADLGNLSAAAQKLQISQPALSKFLTEYEASPLSPTSGTYLCRPLRDRIRT